MLTLYAAQDTITNPPTALTLTVNIPPSATSSSAIGMSGSASGGSGTIAVTWLAGAASGTATGAASAWTISSVPLAVGANSITITATAGSSQVSRSFTVTRLTVPPPPPTTDTTPPTLAITSPGGSTVSTSLASIIISGTASDNVGVQQITWANNFGGSGTASGTTTWSATVPLLTGSNSITIRAFDAAGNSAWRTIVVARH